MDPYYFQLLGFVLDYVVLGLILAFGIRLLLKMDLCVNESQKEYQRGLGLFFISVSISIMSYGIDLTARTFFSGRIFPAATEYREMGYVFDSMHPQSYFILIFTFFLLSLHFIMKPVEMYMMERKKPILSKLCLYSLPLPTMIRILELITLPQEGEASYYIFSALYIVIWLILVGSVLTYLSRYVKIAFNSSGSLKLRSISVVISNLLWMVLILNRPQLLKSLNKQWYMFWIIPFVELMMLFGLNYGFGHNLGETDITGDAKKNNYLYNRWEFEASMIALFVTIAVYFSILFWNNDLALVEYWSNRAAADSQLNAFADFMDRSAFEGEGLGGQDIAYILIIPFVLPYLFAMIYKPLKKKMEENGSLRICGFVMVASVVIALTNRVIKAFFARQRPGSSIEDPSIYSKMWMIGTQTLDDALSHGSFTSGHTTTAMLVVVVTFVLIKTHKTWLCLLSFLASYTFVVLMGVGRVLHRSHYPSDTLWALLVSTVLIVWVYFKVLRMPEQEEGKFRIHKTFGEFQWIFLFLFYAVAILGFLLGVKYSFMEFEWYWPVAAVICPVIAWYLKKRMNFVLYGKKNESKSSK